MHLKLGFLVCFAASFEVSVAKWGWPFGGGEPKHTDYIHLTANRTFNEELQRLLEAAVDPFNTMSKFGGAEYFKLHWNNQNDEGEVKVEDNKITSTFEGIYLAGSCKGRFSGSVDFPVKPFSQTSDESKLTQLSNAEKEVYSEFVASKKQWIQDGYMRFDFKELKNSLLLMGNGRKLMNEDCSNMINDLKEIITSNTLPTNVNVEKFKKSEYMKSEIEGLVKAAVKKCETKYEMSGTTKELFCDTFKGTVSDSEKETHFEKAENFVRCIANTSVQFIGADCADILKNIKLSSVIEKEICHHSFWTKTKKAFWHGVEAAKEGWHAAFYEQKELIERDTGLRHDKKQKLLRLDSSMRRYTAVNMAVSAALIAWKPETVLAFCDDEPIHLLLVPLFMAFNWQKHKQMPYQCKDDKAGNTEELVEKTKTQLSSYDEELMKEDLISMDSFGNAQHPWTIQWSQDPNNLNHVINGANEESDATRITTKLNATFSGFYEGKECRGPFKGLVHLELAKDRVSFDFVHKTLQGRKRQGSIFDLMEVAAPKDANQTLHFAANAFALKNKGASSGAKFNMANFGGKNKALAEKLGKTTEKVKELGKLMNLPWVFERAMHGFEDQISLTSASQCGRQVPEQCKPVDHKHLEKKCKALRQNLQYVIKEELKNAQTPLIGKGKLAEGNIITLVPTGYTDSQINKIVHAAVLTCEAKASEGYDIGGGYIQRFNTDHLKQVFCEGKNPLENMENENSALEAANGTYAFIRCIAKESLKQLGSGCANILNEFDIGRRVEKTLCERTKWGMRWNTAKKWIKMEPVVHGFKKLMGHVWSFTSARQISLGQKLVLSMFAGVITPFVIISAVVVTGAMLFEIGLFPIFMGVNIAYFVTRLVYLNVIKKALAQPCELPGFEVEDGGLASIKDIIEDAMAKLSSSQSALKVRDN